MNPEPTNDYFADIGFWPKGSSWRAYALGYVLSLVLTLIPVILLVIHIQSHHTVFSHPFLRAAAVVGALLQFAVQAIFFLHLAGKGASKERLAIFAAAVLVVGILVGGSIWIMTTLNARQMPSSAQMEQYMQDQDGF